MSSTNLTDNEKIAFMVGFIIVSTVVSYTLQNYQCKSPDSIESNPAFQHLLDSNTLPQPPLGWVGWKLTMWRIFLSLR